ncbi:MAG: hypothetical protein MN733_38230 [Nitrososphaera sp.]|nr:hypothetical protein [Nitrososphaera sp.]
MPKHIFDQLSESNPELMDDFGFRIVEESGQEHSVNSYVIMEAGNIQTKFIRDKGEVFGEIRAKDERASWWNFDLVAELLGTDPTPVRQGFSKPDMLQRLTTFIESNLAAIQQRFVSDRLSTTERELRGIAENLIRKALPPEFFSLVDRSSTNSNPDEEGH